MVVMYKSVEQPSLGGKFGTIDAVLPRIDGAETTYRVAVTLKGKARHIVYPERLLALTGWSEAVNTNRTSAVYEAGAKVYGALQTPSGVAYRAGVIVDQRPDANEYRFQPYTDAGATAWLSLHDIVPDFAPTISQLRTGMRVCAPTEKAGTVYHIGTIQRIETSRIRVNFERFSIAWRKAHEVRVLTL